MLRLLYFSGNKIIKGGGCMVNAKLVDDQLKKIHFNKGWNKPETAELVHILIPDEEIFECVNGWYEGGFALLCATNLRVLLIDKKPFKFLTVEDVRFDTINQIDYNHRMFNASICITAGIKNLTFRSYNQPRLRKLISHVQNIMAEIKKNEKIQVSGIDHNMFDMDQQLRAYLLSQYEQHQSLLRQQDNSNAVNIVNEENKLNVATPNINNFNNQIERDAVTMATGVSSEELYEEGLKEIFGKYKLASKSHAIQINSDPLQLDLSRTNNNTIEVNPLKVAYSKLPLILKKRRQLTV
jgi:hypothetical protein